MNPVAELALVAAVLAAAVALAYAMHWWHERHPAVELVPDETSAVMTAADPWGHPFGIADEDEDG